jgi:mannose-1-phosphate guanylyltransferase/mannose-6-phosphate isomerase
MTVSTQTGDREWAIVLAAGEVQRLARLTRALYGRDVPKQFAALDGDQTMLQQTLTRAARVTPTERTVVVVAEYQGDLAREQLAGTPAARLVEQPRNAGTLCGLLLPLAHVLRADPRASVVVYPADHHVGRLAPFVDAVRGALAAVRHAPARAVLVGASADRPATDLGWIMPGGALAGDVRSVEGFVEKPAASAAAQLLASGALWNTLVIALDGAAFWEGALSTRPELARPFERYLASIGTPREKQVRREIYGELPSLDLSRDYLAKRAGLAVVELADAGWSDCGTPERLFETLAHVGNLDRLLGRLRAGGAGVFAMERGAD